MAAKRKSNRLKKYDYSAEGFYFVTLCTKDRQPIFGDITGGNIVLSDAGNTAEHFWRLIPEHYDNIEIDAYVIMPDHIHGIIIIGSDKGDAAIPHSDRTGRCPVPTNPNSDKTGRCPVPTKCTPYGMLSKIIKSFKNAVSSALRHNSAVINFQWQRSFYDHIIRDDGELRRIREYIAGNAAAWHPDKNINLDTLLKRRSRT